MRRLSWLSRWAFNLSVAVSALLFVVLCVLWMRSYRVRSDLARNCAGNWGWRADRFTSSWGGLACYRQSGPSVVGSRRPVWWTLRETPAKDRGEWTLAIRADAPGGSGYRYRIWGLQLWWWPSRPTMETNERGVRFPYWLLALASAAGPAIRLRRWTASRARLTDGTCPRCGYDLRASRGRCPECGSVPAGKEAT